MPRVLVIGCNGFVGGYLANEFLSQGYSVAGFDITDSAAYPAIQHYHSGSISEGASLASALEAQQPDCIVNLAAISSVGLSWRNPQLTFEINVIGTLNLLEAAKATCPQAKILLIGSSEEYAPSAEPLTESSELTSMNPYGASKVSQGTIAELYSQAYGLQIYRTRSFNHIGPHQSANFAIPDWCTQIAKLPRTGGEVNVGNLDVWRDLSDVRDIARGYRMLIESDYAGRIFNFGSGQAYNLHDILKEIIAISGKDVSIVVDETKLRPAENSFICADCTQANELLKWTPSYTLHESLLDIYSQIESAVTPQ